MDLSNQLTDERELHDLVLQAATHVLPSCGISVQSGTPAHDAAAPTKEVVAFMGFTGDRLRGTISIVTPLEVVRRAYPLELGDTDPSMALFDWAGEVLNRVLGRIKNVLAGRGVAIEASTPRVMLGEHLHVSRPTRGTVCFADFSTDGSWLRLWFDAVSPAGEALFSTPEAEAASIHDEGQVLLF